MDVDSKSGDPCEFTCHLGFCPESLCKYLERGPLRALPKAYNNKDHFGWDPLDVDLNRLCKFACKYGYCPEDVCPKEPDETAEESTEPVKLYPYATDRAAKEKNCNIFKDGKNKDASVTKCFNYCTPFIEKAKEENRMTNYGCVGHWGLDEKIVWQKALWGYEITTRPRGRASATISA